MFLISKFRRDEIWMLGQQSHYLCVEGELSLVASGGRCVNRITASRPVSGAALPLQGSGWKYWPASSTLMLILWFVFPAKFNSIHILTGAELMNIYETSSLTNTFWNEKDVLEEFTRQGGSDTDILGSY